MKKMNNRERTFFLMTVPILILFFAFNTLPLIKGFLYSFTNFKGYGDYDWVGLRNYADLFTDIRVGHSYWFTIKFAVVTTIVVNVISLILALGLNSKIKFKSALRGMYFVPNILGALVVGYICSGGRQYDGRRRLKYSRQHKMGVGWHRHCVRMAGDCHEYDYLHIRSADGAGRCIRSGSDRRGNRLGAF